MKNHKSSKTLQNRRNRNRKLAQQKAQQAIVELERVRQGIDRWLEEAQQSGNWPADLGYMVDQLKELADRTEPNGRHILCC